MQKTSSLNSPVARVNTLPGSADFILWYSKDVQRTRYYQLYIRKSLLEEGGDHYRTLLFADGRQRRLHDEELKDPSLLPTDARVMQVDNLISQGYSGSLSQNFEFEGRAFSPGSSSHWKTTLKGLERLAFAGRLTAEGRTLRYRRFFEDFPVMMINSVWEDIGADAGKTYVVQTPSGAVERCILMTTGPGDLVLDPTCGSGTTAYVAEQCGRRWITIDTSRVALALARARIMAARYPYYLLADSPEGQRKEGEVTRMPPKETPTHGDIRHGFVYERVPHITLKSIANNAEIDVIWEKWQETLEPLQAQLNAALTKTWQEWEIPREAGDPWPNDVAKLWAFANGENDPSEIRKAVSAINTALDRHYTLDTLPDAPRDPWPEEPTRLHAEWWEARIARQKEIDSSIASKAEFEFLYDKPYSDNSRIRVAGPLTVESLSPHRFVPGDQDNSLIHELAEPGADWQDFGQMVLENLKAAGVQQAHKEDRITFTALTPWPGKLISAEGSYSDGERERRAAVLIGPEFGIVSRPDLVDAAREAADASFDVVIACAFNFDARSAELDRIGRIPILKARINPDLHMASELKTTGAGNLFVVFGEPDFEIEPEDEDQIRVKIKGVDVFKPQTGEIESGGPDTIALWFIDTDYNEESFFVRHAYFLSAATDPYKALKTTLKAEIDEEAWTSLNSDTSRPFPKPTSGRIAVKVINHLGDEVMKVFSVR